jgi:hypothetical protein
MMTGNAKRGAAKFTGIAAIAIFYGVCVAVGSHTPFKLFLWTVAAGVCIALLWPTQDEGDAFINRDE